MLDWREIPKAELHLHLEGSIEPETLQELDPGLGMEEIERRYRYADFAGFIESFKWVVGHLREPRDYALVARRLLQRLAAENVRYAEITLSAGVILWRAQEFAPIYDAIWRECAGHAVTVRWVLDAVRQFGPEPAWAVARLAAERLGGGVVAFGLGGDEVRGPVSLFGKVLAFAKESGLRLTLHAGESDGAQSVRDAVRLGAERIGHGVRAVEDPALVEHLRERRIPLEVCLSSNVATGVVGSLEQHPVRRLYEAGVPIVLNTDDPAMFHTTLCREYELAERLGFSPAELMDVVSNGFRFAFGPTPIAGQLP